MILSQDKEGYRIAKAGLLKGKPLHTIFKKKYFEAMKEERVSVVQTILGSPIIEKWEESLIKQIKLLRHHDEYFTILNLQKMELEECFGLANALGYTKKEEENWNLLKQHELIHNSYYSLFWALAALTNDVLREQGIELEPLGPRYIINVPLKKKNGPYVWCKQMSVPLSIDSNGVMVRQLNSYTIVSRYDGVSLPLLPRIFDKDGLRAKHVEKGLFEKLITYSHFTITKTQKRVAQAILKIWQESVDKSNKEAENSEVEESGKLGSPLDFNSIQNIQIAERIMKEWPRLHKNMSVGTVKNYLTEIKKRLHESFDIKFSSNVEAALFLKNLYYI